MLGIGGHLGAGVSALLDGQLDPGDSERAWAHVLACAPCRQLVEHEAWVKAQLRAIRGGEPSARLLGSLYDLDDAAGAAAGVAAGPASGAGADSAAGSRPTWEGIQAWAAVNEIERRAKGRRRAGLALFGAGSVSVAVISFASLGLAPPPAGVPATSIRSTSSASSSPSPARLEDASPGRFGERRGQLGLLIEP
jgi:hypothetical protein